MAHLNYGQRYMISCILQEGKVKAKLANRHGFDGIRPLQCSLCIGLIVMNAIIILLLYQVFSVQNGQNSDNWSWGSG